MTNKPQVPEIGSGAASEQPGSASTCVDGPARSEELSWLEELHGAPVEPYWPRTASDIEKALTWMGEAEQELAEVQAALTAAVAALNARAAAITERANRRYNGLRVLIENWAKANREAVVHGSRKTRDFLAGSISFRASPEKVVVIDEKAVLAWAQPDHLDLLRFPEPEIDKKKLAAFVLSTGEIPVGAEVKPAGESVTVKTIPMPTLGALDHKELKP